MFLAIRHQDKFSRFCPGSAIGVIITSAKRTFIEGKLAARLSDKTSPPGAVLTGSTKTFIEGLPAARIVDQITCKVTMITFAKRTFIA